MATQAHCAYCFEVLAANFERRQPLSLSQVEEFWEQSHAKLSQDPSAGAEEITEADGDIDLTDAETEELSSARPAAVSRLLNGKGTSSAASSSSSLPSQTSSSLSSSKDASGTATPVSSLSSRSSLFSFAGRRTSGEQCPLFVTWNTISKSGNKSLRGCIGTFEPQVLEYGLKSYALTSAFEDVRFQPIPASLLPSLGCHITLLTNFSAPTKDPMDWTLGKHGLRISFTYHGRRYGATYLPDVAREQEWTKEETLISLMRKAGWSGSSGSWQKTWRDGKGELVTYEGKSAGILYNEWREWRNWVNVQGVKGKTS